MRGYADFEFDLPEALLIKLVECLDGLEPNALLSDVVSQIPDAQGVYQLFYHGHLVYIGKTDAEAGLRKRLDRHAKKVQHRHNLQPSEVSFKAVRIYVFTAVDLETQLLHHYKSSGVEDWWNDSGFGANDPGRRRDKTVYKNTHFDRRFPIDIDRDLEIELPATSAAANYLQSLKVHLPFVFRFEGEGKSRRPHPELVNTQILMPEGIKSARGIITAIVKQLPKGWQATALPSHIILYKESDKYPQGEMVAQS